MLLHVPVRRIMQLQGIAAVIHDLRRELQGINTSSSYESEDEECTRLYALVLDLEACYPLFHTMDVVTCLKALLVAAETHHHPRSRVLDNLRKTFIPKLHEAVAAGLASSTAVDDVVLNIAAVAPTKGGGMMKKKKKKKNEYSSFNFDDLDAFEPLEATLSALRTDPCQLAALGKLLEIDVDDFVDNPQWRELLLVVRSSLYRGGQPSRRLALQAHLRFATGLTELQAADAALNLLNFLVDTWMPAAETASTATSASTVAFVAGAGTESGAGAAFLGQCLPRP